MSSWKIKKFGKNWTVRDTINIDENDYDTQILEKLNFGESDELFLDRKNDIITIENSGGDTLIILTKID